MQRHVFFPIPPNADSRRACTGHRKKSNRLRRYLSSPSYPSITRGEGHQPSFFDGRVTSGWWKDSKFNLDLIAKVQWKRPSLRVQMCLPRRRGNTVCPRPCSELGDSIPFLSRQTASFHWRCLLGRVRALLRSEIPNTGATS